MQNLSCNQIVLTSHFESFWSKVHWFHEIFILQAHRIGCFGFWTFIQYTHHTFAWHKIGQYSSTTQKFGGIVSTNWQRIFWSVDLVKKFRQFWKTLKIFFLSYLYSRKENTKTKSQFEKKKNVTTGFRPNFGQKLNFYWIFFLREWN